MATTTPDNITTPEYGDNYDIVAVLAAMAEDVQNALNKRDNTVVRGTQAQRAAAEATTATGTVWVDTDGINMIWRKAGSFVPAVWNWSGTQAQRNAFAAPNGFTWFDTTQNKLFYRAGGTWVTRDRVLESGWVSMPSGGLTQVGSTGIWAATLTAVIPTTLAPGEYIEIQSIGHGTGWGIISQNSVGTTSGSNTNVGFRFIQVGSATSQNLNIAWKKMAAPA